MNRAIRHAALLALGAMGLTAGCRGTADPAQMQAVNTLITEAEAAMLTLNELDRGRYHRADSVFRAQLHRYDDAFADTLGPEAATVLGQHYLVLRSAGAMGRDHDRIMAELRTTGDRLRDLRNDLATGLIDPARAATAIATERTLLRELMRNVQRCIDNYRLVQRTAGAQPKVDSLLATVTPDPARP